MTTKTTKTPTMMPAMEPELICSDPEELSALCAETDDEVGAGDGGTPDGKRVWAAVGASEEGRDVVGTGVGGGDGRGEGRRVGNFVGRGVGRTGELVGFQTGCRPVVGLVGGPMYGIRVGGEKMPVGVIVGTPPVGTPPVGTTAGIGGFDTGIAIEGFLVGILGPGVGAKLVGRGVGIVGACVGLGVGSNLQKQPSPQISLNEAHNFGTAGQFFWHGMFNPFGAINSAPGGRPGNIGGVVPKAANPPFTVSSSPTTGIMTGLLLMIPVGVGGRTCALPASQIMNSGTIMNNLLRAAMIFCCARAASLVIARRSSQFQEVKEGAPALPRSQCFVSASMRRD